MPRLSGRFPAVNPRRIYVDLQWADRGRASLPCLFVIYGNPSRSGDGDYSEQYEQHGLLDSRELPR